MKRGSQRNPGHQRRDGQGLHRGKYKRVGERVREWRKQLNTILLQAPVEATFKCVSVLSGCRSGSHRENNKTG